MTWALGRGTSCGNSFAEPDFDFGGVYVAHAVQQFFRLRLNGGDDAGMAVADGGDAEGRSHIQKSVAVHVPDQAALGPLPENREIRGEIGDVGAFDPAQALGQCA